MQFVGIVRVRWSGSADGTKREGKGLLDARI